MVSECEYEPIGKDFGHFLHRGADLLESVTVKSVDDDDDGIIMLRPCEEGEYALVRTMTLPLESGG